MGTIMSYLVWRGDITFSERSFNDIDNLVLAELAYIDFNGIAPGIEQDEVITLETAAIIHKRKYEENPTQFELNSVVTPELLYRMGESKRFKRLKLSNYIDITDDEEKVQFAALHIGLEDGTTYIAFRGTDTTITGWREDFSMSFQIVPAQKKALDYLNSTASKPQKKYRIGGHSKGGILQFTPQCYVMKTYRIG